MLKTSISNELENGLELKRLENELELKRLENELGVGRLRDIQELNGKNFY